MPGGELHGHGIVVGQDGGENRSITRAKLTGRFGMRNDLIPLLARPPAARQRPRTTQPLGDGAGPLRPTKATRRFYGSVGAGDVSPASSTLWSRPVWSVVGCYPGGRSLAGRGPRHGKEPSRASRTCPWGPPDLA